MLVLSRRLDESVMIGADIEVTVVAIGADKVRLGITAPAAVGVHRREVFLEIQREARAAPTVPPASLAAGRD